MIISNLNGPLDPAAGPVVVPACRLCPYIGPAHRIDTEPRIVLEAVAQHANDAHPSVLNAPYPRILFGVATDASDAGLLALNAARAANPYGPLDTGLRELGR
ncbi:hypothetical protein ABTY59_33615 [Streptomyces sp. NPDC096079]|uniref:hypothetical protein n=1 Tax=Streptomyces sp. NPDC096079 TaxID=3155820 RepID=UPI003324B3C6